MGERLAVDYVRHQPAWEEGKFVLYCHSVRSTLEWSFEMSLQNVFFMQALVFSVQNQQQFTVLQYLLTLVITVDVRSVTRFNTQKLRILRAQYIYPITTLRHWSLRTELQEFTPLLTIPFKAHFNIILTSTPRYFVRSLQVFLPIAWMHFTFLVRMPHTPHISAPLISLQYCYLARGTLSCSSQLITPSYV